MQLGTTVSVDDDFARFGNKSYAINKINSVEVRSRRPFGQGTMFVLGLLGVILVASAAGQLPNNPGGAVLTLMFAAFLGFLAYRSWLKSKTIEYQLFLMTSSSEAQAFVTRDRNEVQALRDRIESAMARKPGAA